MGKCKIKKPEPTTVQAICVTCNKNKQAPRGKNKNGERLYKAICNSCNNKRYNISNNKYRRSYRQFKKDACDECGFKAKHPIQLDCHHMDSNHNNNAESNIQTLCANCHRLKHIPIE